MFKIFQGLSDKTIKNFHVICTLKGSALCLKLLLSSYLIWRFLGTIGIRHIPGGGLAQLFDSVLYGH